MTSCSLGFCVVLHCFVATEPVACPKLASNTGQHRKYIMLSFVFLWQNTISNLFVFLFLWCQRLNWTRHLLDSRSATTPQPCPPKFSTVKPPPAKKHVSGFLVPYKNRHSHGTSERNVWPPSLLNLQEGDSDGKTAVCLLLS